MKPRIPTSRKTAPTSIATVWIGERSRMYPLLCGTRSCLYCAQIVLSSTRFVNPCESVRSGDEKSERDRDEGRRAQCSQDQAVTRERVVHARAGYRLARERGKAEQENRRREQCHEQRLDRACGLLDARRQDAAMEVLTRWHRHAACLRGGICMRRGHSFAT